MQTAHPVQMSIAFRIRDLKDSGVSGVHYQDRRAAGRQEIASTLGLGPAIGAMQMCDCQHCIEIAREQRGKHTERITKLKVGMGLH